MKSATDLPYKIDVVQLNGDVISAAEVHLAAITTSGLVVKVYNR
jgi:hypothetical protein